MDQFRPLLVEQRSRERLREAEEWRLAKMATAESRPKPAPKPKVADAPVLDVPVLGTPIVEVPVLVPKLCRVQLFGFCLIG